MLIEFTIGNYRSFKDPVTFSMVAAKLTAKDKALDCHNVFALTDSLSLLKSCAIYGANASGKSNLMLAFRFIRNFVLNSSKDSQAGEPIRVDRFLLSTETESKPSFFEIVFFTEGKRYRYGFTVDTQRVQSEWLYHAKVKETNLFYREGSKFELSSVFKEGKGLTEKTRDNALFLSVVAQFNGEIALIVLRWFQSIEIKAGNVFSRIFEVITPDDTVRYMESDRSRKQEILSLMKRLDVGITDIKIKWRELDLAKHLPEGLLESQASPQSVSSPNVSVLHTKYDEKGKADSLVALDFDLHESGGTRKIFSIAGQLLDILRNGRILIIDELDTRLHPLLTESIIRLFNSNETNPNDAQLVFTTHDTNLLTNKLFRRDQIWFTEKNRYGATDLYSLAEFKVRNDASYEKDYIAGKYGAIPFIGGPQRLVAEGTDG